MLKSFAKLIAGLLLLASTVVQAEPVSIDVRTVEEYAADHIEGDLNLPLAELDTAAIAERFGKDAELVLYCRTGNRSGQALEKLVAAGFPNVSNGGGIGDVRKLRAEASPAAGAAGNSGAVSAANQ
ncbi:MAG: rhodanese-like domain-containing protein [Pseudohongiellaceae bacterium]